MVVANEWRPTPAPAIVSPDWCRKCRDVGYFYDTGPYILQNPHAAQNGFGPKPAGQAPHLLAPSSFHADQAPRQALSAYVSPTHTVKHSAARIPSIPTASPSSTVTTKIEGVPPPAPFYILSSAGTSKSPILIDLDPVSPKKTASVSVTGGLTNSNPPILVKHSGSIPVPPHLQNGTHGPIVMPPLTSSGQIALNPTSTAPIAPPMVPTLPAPQLPTSSSHVSASNHFAPLTLSNIIPTQPAVQLAPLPADYPFSKMPLAPSIAPASSQVSRVPTPAPFANANAVPSATLTSPSPSSMQTSNGIVPSAPAHVVSVPMPAPAIVDVPPVAMEPPRHAPAPTSPAAPIPSQFPSSMATDSQLSEVPPAATTDDEISAALVNLKAPYAPTESQRRELKQRLVDSDDEDDEELFHAESSSEFQVDDDDAEESTEGVEPIAPAEDENNNHPNNGSTKETNTSLAASDFSTDFEEEGSFYSVGSDDSPRPVPRKKRSKAKETPENDITYLSSSHSDVSSEESFHPMSEDESDDEPLEFDENYDSALVKEEVVDTPEGASTHTTEEPLDVESNTPSPRPPRSSTIAAKPATSPSPPIETLRRTTSGTIVKQSTRLPPLEPGPRAVDPRPQPRPTTLPASSLDLELSLSTNASHERASPAPFLNGFGDSVYDSQTPERVSQSSNPLQFATSRPTINQSATNSQRAASNLPAASSLATDPPAPFVAPNVAATAANAPSSQGSTSQDSIIPHPIKKRTRQKRRPSKASRTANGMDLDDLLSEHSNSSYNGSGSSDEGEPMPKTLKKKVKLSTSNDSHPAPAPTTPSSTTIARTLTPPSSRVTFKSPGTPTPKANIRLYLCGTKNAEFEYENQELHRLNIPNVAPLVKSVANATHVVVSDTAERTETILRAITTGKWVLRYKWYSNMMRTGKILSEEDYELHHLWPGTRAARLEFAEHSALHLFDGEIFNTSFLSSDLEFLLTDLVEAAGGRTGSRDTALTIVDDESYRTRENAPNTVPVRYVTDCIANWTFFSLKEWEERNRNFLGR